MKHATTRIMFVIALALLFSLPSFAADSLATPSKEERQRRMEVWKDVSTPGPEHALLAKMAGKWDAKLIMSWFGTGKEQVFHGTQNAEMILGGRYLWVMNESNIGGMPSESRLLFAYDKFRKEYELIWIDNMGTMILGGHGTGSDDGKTITMHGKMDDPLSGTKDKPVDYVFKFIDDDHYKKEMWLPSEASTLKVMEVEFTRVK